MYFTRAPCVSAVPFDETPEEPVLSAVAPPPSRVSDGEEDAAERRLHQLPAPKRLRDSSVSGRHERIQSALTASDLRSALGALTQARAAPRMFGLCIWQSPPSDGVPITCTALWPPTTGHHALTGQARLLLPGGFACTCTTSLCTRKLAPRAICATACENIRRADGQSVCIGWCALRLQCLCVPAVQY